jgi:hypothetical protein
MRDRGSGRCWIRWSARKSLASFSRSSKYRPTPTAVRRSHHSSRRHMSRNVPSQPSKSRSSWPSAAGLEPFLLLLARISCNEQSLSEFRMSIQRIKAWRIFIVHRLSVKLISFQSLGQSIPSFPSADVGFLNTVSRSVIQLLKCCLSIAIAVCSISCFPSTVFSAPLFQLELS